MKFYLYFHYSSFSPSSLLHIVIEYASSLQFVFGHEMIKCLTLSVHLRVRILMGCLLTCSCHRVWLNTCVAYGMAEKHAPLSRFPISSTNTITTAIAFVLSVLEVCPSACSPALRYLEDVQHKLRLLQAFGYFPAFPPLLTL